MVETLILIVTSLMVMGLIGYLTILGMASILDETDDEERAKRKERNG